MMPASVSALLDLSLFLAACLVITGLGIAALRAFRLPYAGTAEALLFSFAAGLGLTGYAGFLLSALGLLRPAVLWTAFALLALAAVVGWRRFLAANRQGGEPASAPETPPSHVRLERLSAGLLAVLLLLCLLLALAPETGKDALVYHLALPKRYLREGGFRFLPGDIFSNSPLHSEMLYTLALFLRDEITAKLLHFGALAGILLGMWSFSRRHLAENTLPWTGMLVFLAIPTVFSISAMAYSDLFVALYTFCAVYALVNWADRGPVGWLALSGGFTGLSVACKYTALLLPLLGALAVLLGARRRGETALPALRDLLLYGGVAALVGSPFYVKNYLFAGNPFFPFLYGVFGGRGWDPAQAQLYDAAIGHLGMGRQWSDYLLLPWNLSFRAQMNSPRFDGILGPVFLGTLPFLLVTDRISVWLKTGLIFSLCWFLFWAASAQQMRYLIPIFPFLSLAAAVVLSRLAERPGRWLSGAAGLVVIGSLALNGSHILHELRKHRPLAVISGAESRDAYLERLIPQYGMYRFADRHLPADSRIFLIYMRNYTYLCRTECFSDSYFESYTIRKILSGAGSIQDVATALRAGGFTHIMYDARFVYGRWSLFTPEQRELFHRFEDRKMTLLHEEGPSRLFRIDD